MSDIKRICAAMAALVNALPGSSHDRVTGVSLHGCDGARFRAIVDAGANVQSYQSDDGTEEWQSASLYVDNIQVVAYSEHRPIVRREVDQDVVAAALAMAEEAVSS